MTRQAMTTVMMAVVTVIPLAFAATRVLAHEEFRVIGTITKHVDSSISVRDKNAKTIAIRLDKQTKITRNKQKVEVTELKVGASVVVDAYGDSEADLLALDIAIVPPIGAKK